jgi:hypothetical protein
MARFSTTPLRRSGLAEQWVSAARRSFAEPCRGYCRRLHEKPNPGAFGSGAPTVVPDHCAVRPRPYCRGRGPALPKRGHGARPRGSPTFGRQVQAHLRLADGPLRGGGPARDPHDPLALHLPPSMACPPMSARGMMVSARARVLHRGPPQRPSRIAFISAD